MSLLVLLAIVLLIIAGHQLLKIIELSRSLKKTKEWQISDSDNNMMGKAMLLFMFLFFSPINGGVLGFCFLLFSFGK